ncbi:MAG: hypothetical protein ACFHXK_21085 [bacterium]
MTFSKTISLMFCACSMIGIALTAPNAGAAPCVLEKDKWGNWVGNCLLTDFLGKEQLLNLVLDPPTPIFLPDLYADDGDYFVNAGTVEISVRTGNDGSIISNDFDVTATVTISSANVSPQTVTVTGRVNGQAPGTRTRTVLGVITLPNRIDDWDLETVFTVDSDDFINGGEIRESVETNNVFNDGICRVFGQNPDTTVDACD